MKIEDRSFGDSWMVKIVNVACPHIYYPNVIIGCRMKEDTDNNYCEKATCPLLVDAAIKSESKGGKDA